MPNPYFALNDNGKKIIGIIPARGGSKGIPFKNITELNGKPLIAYMIEATKKSKLVNRVIVSTDSKKIAKISKQYGAEVVRRPIMLSGDKASSESALLHVLNYLKEKENYDPELVVFLQCTAPLITTCDIDNTIETLMANQADTGLAVCEFHHFLWEKDNKRDAIGINHDKTKRYLRQQMKTQYKEAGSVYVMRAAGFKKYKHRFFGKTIIHVIPRNRCLEIDEPQDLELAEFMLAKHKVIDKNIASNIKMILFDIDGVFTDGSVYVDKKGREALKFSRIDGKGVELLRSARYILGAISSENSEMARERMEKLKIKEIHLGARNKLKIYNALKRKYNLKDKEICFCGDDVQDIDVLKKSGLACCPLNANDEVKKVCDFVSSKKGAGGFVREMADIILKSRPNK